MTAILDPAGNGLPGSRPGWTRACRYDELQPERGVAALVGDDQVAVFRRLRVFAVRVVDGVVEIGEPLSHHESVRGDGG